MESFRALIGRKKETVSDEEVFVEEIRELLKPHLQAVYVEMGNDGLTITNIEQYTTEEALQRLLKKFFNLAKTDNGLNKFMIPIMMYLRSARMKRGIK